MGNLDSTAATSFFNLVPSGSPDPGTPLPGSARDSRSAGRSEPSFADLISSQGGRTPSPAAVPGRTSGPSSKPALTQTRSPQAPAPSPDRRPGAAAQDAPATSTASPVSGEESSPAADDGDVGGDGQDASKNPVPSTAAPIDQQAFLAGSLSTPAAVLIAAPSIPLGSDVGQAEPIDPMVVGGVGVGNSGSGSVERDPASGSPLVEDATGQNPLAGRAAGRNLPTTGALDPEVSAAGAAASESASAKPASGPQASLTGAAGAGANAPDLKASVGTVPAVSTGGDPAAGLVSEALALRTRVLMGSRGTSTAQVEGVMKTETSQTAGTRPASAGAPTSSAAVPGVPVAASRSGSQGFSGSRDDREGASNARNASAISAFAHGMGVGSAQGFSTEVTEVGGPQGPGSVAGINALRDEIQMRAVEVRTQDLSSMTVVLRPDPSTELAIQLRSSGDRVEVHVRVERGDSTALQGQWTALQESLSHRGVSLSALETAPLPSLPPAPHVRETGTDPTSASLVGMTDARLVGVSSMNLSAGPDSRDPQGRSGGSADAFASSLGDGSGTRGGGFGGSQRSPADAAAGSSGVFETGGRPGARAGTSAVAPRNLAEPRASAAAGPVGGPWESWA
jgi:hypothetical protein